MKMTAWPHLICHFYCNFSISCLNPIHSGMMFQKKPVTTPSDRFFIIKYDAALLCLFLILPIIKYSVCRIYSEENPQDFRFPVPFLYS